MGYKCLNCNVDFPSKKEQVEHMIDVHSSPFLEGDDGAVIYSKEFVNKNVGKSQKFARIK